MAGNFRGVLIFVIFVQLITKFNTPENYQPYGIAITIERR